MLHTRAMPLDLETYLPLLIGVLAERASRKARASYADEPCSPGEVRLLLALDALPGSRAADMARALQLDKGLVSRTVASLDGKGLVAGSGAGARATLNLTAAGHAEVKRLMPTALMRQEAILEGIDESDRPKLFAMIRQMIENLA